MVPRTGNETEGLQAYGLWETELMYPTNIPAWRTSLLAYEPGEDHADAIYEAQAMASPVVATVKAFNALKGADGLSEDGLKVLLGAAHLIASGGWHGLAGEAATLIGQRARELDPLPDPETEEA